MMCRLLSVLGVLLGITSGDCSTYVDLAYGEEFSLKVPTAASALEFTPEGSYSSFVLWSRINAANKKGSRGTFTYGRWKARTMTQADQGSYAFLRKSGGQISSTVVTVHGKSQHYHVADESIKDNWQVQVDVPAHEAQVIYFPSAEDKVMLFQNGVETDEGFQLFGDRIKLEARSRSTRFSIARVQPSDAGQYEIRDKKGHLAMTMHLERDPVFNPKSLIEPLGITAGVIAGLLCCCWCCCKCCSDSDKDETTAASPDEEAPVHVHDTIILSGSGDPLQPSSSMRNLAPPSGEMSTHDPWQSSPPLYTAVIRDEVPGEGGAGGGTGDNGVAPSAPTPPPAYPALQYQPVAWSSGLGDFLSYSPLSMGAGGTTADADNTYTSNKLNF